MQKLKVGFVLDDTLDTPDGVQQYVLAVGKWMVSQGHEVHYLVGNTKRTDLQNIHSLSKNLKVKFNQNKLSVPLPASSSKIKKLLDELQLDVLHVQMPYSPALAAKIINSAPDGTAIVGTFHVAPYNKTVYLANKLLGATLKKSLKRFDEVISVSTSASKLAKDAFKVDSHILPNAVDLSPFFKTKKSEDKSLNIVFLGRLVPRKGCQYLLRAAKCLKESDEIDNSTWKVIVCGDGLLRKELEDYVKNNYLKDNVSFEGFISEQSKPGYLARADVAVYPSTGGESFGIVLIEAMAAARGALLAGDNEGYKTVLSDHPDALFEPKDTAEFTKLLITYLNDRRIRENARKWQLNEAEKYDISTVGPKILGIYGSALRKRLR